MKTAYLKFDGTKTVSHINREIYGHFSEHLGRCIYDGIYVGKDSAIPNQDGIRLDVVEALKEIGTPVLRWPGGCFADEYHWKDGVGQVRRPIYNTHWGCVTEDNSFGTHEFFALCEMLDCEPYLAGNLGSGTVQELAEWVAYITASGDAPAAVERRKNGREQPWHLPFLGIGNENWGGGGNMRAEAYADEYRRYQTFAKNFSDPSMVKVACGPNAADYAWTRVLMERLQHWHVGAISLHYYTIPTGDWEKKGAALTFDDAEYYRTIAGTMQMEELLQKHIAIMEEYDPEGKIGLIVDEWGCWYDVEEGTNPAFLYQQNTMRDAIVAAINLNLFNQYSYRVKMANLAQVMNVLQSVLLSDGERLVKTPTWQIFKLFRQHHDAELVRTSFAGTLLDEAENTFPMLTQSLSVKDGRYFLTISNCSLEEDCNVLVEGEHGAIAKAAGQIVTADIRAYNDFDDSTPVAVAPYDGVSLDDGTLWVTVPAHSVVAVCFEEA